MTCRHGWARVLSAEFGDDAVEQVDVLAEVEDYYPSQLRLS